MMLTNPISIIILVVSTCLILVALFSKKLKLKHRKQVEALKEYDDSLSDKERKEQTRLQYATIIFIEVALVLLVIFGFVVIQK